MNLTRQYRNWVGLEVPRRPLVIFRILFALVWLTYDVIDLSMAQTLKNVWFIRAPLDPRFFTALQIALIFFELGLLIGYRARWFAFGAFIARAMMSYVFALNDFLYFTATALILSQADCENSAAPALKWPRDVLVLQTAWIYLASAFLKMNPLFLSGGDLYVRLNYTAKVMPLYYPNFYIQWISNLAGDAILAWAGVIAEVSLGLLLLSWWRWPDRRKTLRIMILFLTLAIHGYAIYALDVFFFSFAMIAQVWALTSETGNNLGRRQSTCLVNPLLFLILTGRPRGLGPG